MSAELDKARGALESFDATRDAYEDARTRDDRTYLLSMLDNHDAHDVDHLRAALAEVDRLTAALAEAEATIANESGGGEPPEPGWTWGQTQNQHGVWFHRASGMTVQRTASGVWYWISTWSGFSPDKIHDTARAAMRAATLKETP